MRKGGFDMQGTSSIVMNNAVTHKNPRIREGGISIIEHLGDLNIAERIIDHIKSESDLQVKRASLRCIHHLGKRLPHDVAQYLFKHDPDWVVQSYALSHLPESRSCLLIPDGTDFAAELGGMAQGVGFELVTLSAPRAFYTITEMQDIETEVLKAHDLMILVKGEHYMRAEGHDYYSKIRQFVIEGGYLVATSWVGWENVYNQEFSEVLPFSSIEGAYYENVEITCQSTESELAQRLFPERISYITSFERLQSKADAVVLLETEDNIPIFGFRRFGKGVCYYFNTCQHVCFGTMPSPFQVNSQLANSFQRVFQWIFDTLQHEAGANKALSSV
jgi:hypothetical protein